MAAVSVDPARVHEFEDDRAFERWLRKNWNKEPELWIKIHKLHSGLPSITAKQAIDVALCWGWIDGIRKGYDEVSFLQRYTPRGRKSVWSAVNVANVERLIAAGRMQPSGLAHVEAAKADGRWAKAYSMANTETPADLLEAIRAEPKALATYERLSSQNRFALTFRTLAMKTAQGRAKKIAAFVEMLRDGKVVHPSSKTVSSKAVSSKAVSSMAVSSKTVSSKTVSSKTVSSKTVTSKVSSKPPKNGKDVQGSGKVLKVAKRGTRRGKTQR